MAQRSENGRRRDASSHRSHCGVNCCERKREEWIKNYRKTEHLGSDTDLAICLLWPCSTTWCCLAAKETNCMQLWIVSSIIQYVWPRSLNASNENTYTVLKSPIELKFFICINLPSVRDKSICRLNNNNAMGECLSAHWPQPQFRTTQIFQL